ncbi:PIG-L deacetylase family protein [Thermus filiformis]|uniref:PIG-L deacetylase family protein n=1 Tax=Thermus filiformis TaxID=276 RepID=UPI000A702044|nr:PIG-L family deacetylase [Thermus filiformis]
MRRIRPWQWLLLFLLAYVALTEAVRLWAGLVWAERVALLVGGVAVWAFINGRFVFAFYHAFLTSLRVKDLPLWAPKAEHLLVLAPHPDDEVLAAGGQIHEVLRRGGRVSVVYLTSGDGFDLAAASPLSPKALRHLALRRMVEARQGAEALGLSRKDLYFLGFPDQGLYELFTTHYLVPYESPYTRLFRVVYPGCYRLGAPYTGRALEALLEELLARLRPDRILLPSPLDAHRDHQATAHFGMRAAAELGMEGRLTYYLVHGGYQYPLPKGLHPRLPLYPPPRGRGLAWVRVELSPEAVAAKERAIRAHRSQMRLLGRFLLAFVRRNELYSTLPVPARESLLEETLT